MGKLPRVTSCTWSVNTVEEARQLEVGLLYPWSWPWSFRWGGLVVNVLSGRERRNNDDTGHTVVGILCPWLNPAWSGRPSVGEGW